MAESPMESEREEIDAIPSDIEEIQEIPLGEEEGSEDNGESFVQPIDSVQIASPTQDIPMDDDPMLVIQLGDRVVIQSSIGETTGLVYYRSLELIRVRPDGVSNQLVDFEMEQTEDGEVFNEESGVTVAYVIEKRMEESFVRQHDYRVNQPITTYALDGTSYQNYTIVDVNEEMDSMTIQDENEEELVLEFEFIGINREVPFVVIRVLPETTDVSEDTEASEETEAPEIQEEEPDAQVETGIKLVGVIEVAQPIRYEEAISYEQRIPDNLQKLDALNDFISGLDPVLQRDPYAIRSTRILVETLYHLQKSTISYEKNGSIEGPADVSSSTITELIQTSHLPLGRPILDVSKKEYIVDDYSPGDSHAVHFTNFNNELMREIARATTDVSMQVKGAKAESSSILWHTTRTFLDSYLSPWKSNPLSADKNAIWNAFADSDYFRTSPPDNQSNLPGYTPSHTQKFPPVFDTIPFGMERALSTTYRKGVDRRKESLMEQERATMNFYLLFPLSVANSLGTSRSRELAIDSGRSGLPPKTMKMIWKEIGMPTEMGMSTDPLLIPVSEQGMGDIRLSDYIEGAIIPCLGIGDAIPALEQYGMGNMELNEDVMNALQRKTSSYQSQLLSTLGTLRTMMESEPPIVPILNPFLDAPDFLNTIQTQSLLREDLEEYKHSHPTLAESDIGKVNHLMKHHPQLFQMTAAKGSSHMAKAFNDAIRSLYVNRLKINHLLQSNLKGIRPKKNMCRHVSLLVSVRKLKNDTERFHELSKLFRQYNKGARDANWFTCNVCDENLLCVHERLQLQAYLNPREKDTIEKEIILSFAGGQFQGKYICRNCGQPIRELEFDNHLEFDSNGVPKSGSTVLTDEDALLEEQLNMAGNVSFEPSPKEKMNLTKHEEACYDVIQTLSKAVGIQLDDKGYGNIIRNTLSWVSHFPDAATYRRDAQKTKESSRSKSSRPDYEVASARNMISACGIFLLLEVQTKIPSYITRNFMEGCKDPGFGGYPLEHDEMNKEGIHYIACAISSLSSDALYKNVSPWNIGFKLDMDSVSRQNGIIAYMDKIMKKVIGGDIIQSQLSEKRNYLAEINGISEDGRPNDRIPSTFLPEQLVLSASDAAKDVIQPEVLASMGEQGQAGLVTLWIRQAHLLARTSTPLIKSPFSEATCCVNKIDEPGAFWKSAGLPEIRSRTLLPHSQGRYLLSMFTPRETEPNVTEPNKELYHRLFLKYCFKGPRIGQYHEPDLTNECLWCGFQFPHHPSVMDADVEGKAALSDEKTDTPEFNALLDIIHTNNRVLPAPLPIPIGIETTLLEWANSPIPPIENWKEMITSMTTQLMKLNRHTEDAFEIATVAGELSQAVLPYKERIVERYAEKKVDRLGSKQVRSILEHIASLSWFDFFNVLQTYFITPFQRIIVSFTTESLSVPVELVESLSKIHVDEYLTPMLKIELALFFERFAAGLHDASHNFAKRKLATYVERLSAIMHYRNRIRPTMIPGKKLVLEYFQQAILYGPLERLLDSSDESGESHDSMDAMSDPSMDFLLSVMQFQLKKFTVEQLSYDDKQLKDKIAMRNEKERVTIIKKFDALTDEERQVELINKRLGLGEWAVGGTKAIYAYDKEYYDLEREKRMKAGITDGPGPEHTWDEFGCTVYTDEELEREGGYNHTDMEEEDA